MHLIADRKYYYSIVIVSTNEIWNSSLQIILRPNTLMVWKSFEEHMQLQLYNVKGYFGFLNLENYSRNRKFVKMLTRVLLWTLLLSGSPQERQFEHSHNTDGEL